MIRSERVALKLKVTNPKVGEFCPVIENEERA